MNSSQATNESVPPPCTAEKSLFGDLQPPSFFFQGVLILYIIMNIVTVPVTVVLNTLVMIAVKTKSRLRAQKSNIVLAMLALTDLLVGILAQPIFIDGMISILLQESNDQSCLTEILSFAISNCLFTSSLLHLALASGERYVAIKYPYQHITIITEARLLVASLLTWFLAVMVHVALAVDTFLFYKINNIVILLSFAVIIFCHFSVYIETRRHKNQVAAQQVTQEARKQFEKDKKAFKLTSTIIGVLLLCYSPLMFCRLFLVIIYTPSLNTFYIIGFFAVTVVYLNSLLNPVIYCIRIRQFRVAFIELTFRNVNVASAEEMESSGLEHKTLWLDAKLSIIKEGQNNKIMKNEMSTKIDILCVGYLHGVATDSSSALQVISSSILSFRFPDLDFQIPFSRRYHKLTILSV